MTKREETLLKILFGLAILALVVADVYLLENGREIEKRITETLEIQSIKFCDKFKAACPRGCEAGSSCKTCADYKCVPKGFRYPF
jgi:hypothetical protein